MTETLITTTDALAAFCERIGSSAFITVDTEFLRENTYYPLLCLVQVAGADAAAAIDPMAPDMDLSPLYRLLAEERILKVFHAARQDIEIFINLTGAVPSPLFDTQIAAMVCGFGEQVAYEQLVARLADVRVDKSSRFTDWSRRPLTDRQVAYALSDVTHLRTAYEALRRQLVETGRLEWLAEEMAVLADPATYRNEPDEAWRRFRVRASDKPRFLACLKTLAAWREREAQRRDIPRSRLLRDEALMEIAAHAPTTAEDLARTRGLNRGFAESRQGQEVLEAVRDGLALPASAIPKPDGRPDPPPGIGPIVELLKVLLKMVCDESGVAAKMVATTADLEAIAGDDEADVAALAGWRRELFGDKALRLKRGELALAISRGRVRAVPTLTRPM